MRASFSVDPLRSALRLQAGSFALDAVMEDVDIALLLSFFVVLIQTISQVQRPHDADDDILFDTAASAGSAMDSHDSHMAMSTAALYDYRISTGLLCFDDELRYWVKPRCTLWFSQFLMSLYDDSRWIEFFQIDKGMVAGMCYRLRGAVEKQNTKYRLAVPVEVRVCCCLYKLAQGANFLACSEKFAIGRSTVSLVIREVVQEINHVYRDALQWP